MLAAIEAGGTKFVCGVGDAGGSLDRIVVPTSDVDTTLGQVADFLDAAIARHGALQAIGIGSFGPIQLDRSAPDYGCITTTPKVGWPGADMPGWLGKRFGVPIAIDTDVNAAALAEAQLAGTDRLAYATVGTGIGIGLVIDGRTQVGFGHPEGGHISVARHPAHDGFSGICPYHGDCLEGLASGTAITAAWGASLAELADDHPAWAAEADYIAQLCTTLILTATPQQIVLGGGVMQQPRLLPLVRQAIARRLNGYCPHWDEAALADRIRAPLSVEPSGLVGAYLLAAQIAEG